MSCISKHYLNENSILGVWKIEEDIDTLMSMVTLTKEDRLKFETFRSRSRKVEFLSVRAMLRELLGPKASIVYGQNNKPFIKDGSHFISISHSNRLTAILLSTNERVGIDLEYMSSNISAFAFKFLNRREKVTRNRDWRKYHLYIHWCAKEALYKICDKQGLNIRNNITIEPFEPGETGEIIGNVSSDTIKESFALWYMRYENYALVWTKKVFDDDNIPNPKKPCPAS